MNKDDDRHDLILDRPDGFFVHDAQGRFLDINEQSSIDLGYSREELLAMTINDISIGATPAENAVKWGNAEPGMAMTFREIAVRRDGSSYPVEISVTCQMMQNRKVFVGLARRVNDQVLQPDTAPALRGSLFELSSLQQQRHLLDRFQVLATDMDRLKRSALAVFGVRELHVSSAPFEVRASVVSLNELGLVYVATTTDFTCSFPKRRIFVCSLRLVVAVRQQRQTHSPKSTSSAHVSSRRGNTLNFTCAAATDVSRYELLLTRSNAS